MRRRRRFPWRSMMLVVVVLFAVWLVGLFNFASRVVALEVPGDQQTDAIVALTGELVRLREGIALLKDEQSERLFISGVYRGVDVEELLAVLREDAEGFDCCIDVGYVATNTRGNAVETAEWVEAENVHSVRLVTSNYHMPRTLLEFRRLMPTLEILPHPVISERAKDQAWYTNPRSARLLATEFSKYLIVRAGG